MTLADKLAKQFGGVAGRFISCAGAKHHFLEVIKKGTDTFTIVDSKTNEIVLENVVNQTAHANIHYVKLENNCYAFLDSLTGKIICQGSNIDNCEDFNIFINPWIYYENFYANSYLELFFNFNPETFKDPNNREFIINCLKVLKSELKSNYYWWKEAMPRFDYHIYGSNYFSFANKTGCKNYIKNVTAKIKVKLAECGYISIKSEEERNVDEILDGCLVF